MARSFSSKLFRAARAVRTIEQIEKGRMPLRAKNIVVGRALGRAGFWNKLWGRVVVVATNIVLLSDDAIWFLRGVARSSDIVMNALDNAQPEAELVPDLIDLAQDDRNQDVHEARIKLRLRGHKLDPV